MKVKSFIPATEDTSLQFSRSCGMSWEGLVASLVQHGIVQVASPEVIQLYEWGIVFSQDIPNEETEQKEEDNAPQS